MSKYEIPDDHWQDSKKDNGEQWREQTSAAIDVEVTLHEQGYQNDRKWTVTIRELHDGSLLAGYAAEHQNKGNFWREPTLWRDAVDFVELPRPVRERTAAMLNRTVGEITPDERMIHREDGRGVGDRAAEHSGRCDVCGGRVYEDADTHEECVRG